MHHRVSRNLDVLWDYINSRKINHGGPIFVADLREHQTPNWSHPLLLNLVFKLLFLHIPLYKFVQAHTIAHLPPRTHVGECVGKVLSFERG